MSVKLTGVPRTIPNVTLLCVVMDYGHSELALSFEDERVLQAMTLMGLSKTSSVAVTY